MARKPSKPKKLTKKAMKAMTPMTLHINDELPRIGSGVRHVLVKKMTPSYVHLYYGGKPMRVKRAIFDKVVKND